MVKALIKRPDEKIGHMTNISTRLKQIQKHVDGKIEIIKLMERDGHQVVMIVNEEGKLRNLEPNILFMQWPFQDVIVGTLIVAQYGPDGELEDLTMITRPAWKELLADWGNDDTSQ